MQHKAGFWFPDSDTHFGQWTFELDHLEAVLPLLKNSRLAIDGGAHIGSWSTRMAEVFDKVMSFEPLSANYECLKENTKDLKNVETFNVALGDIPGTGSMHSPVNPGNSGAGWMVDGNDFEVTTIDMLGLDDVDFIKLDVEGFEPFAIVGAEETLKRCKPIVLIEQKEITARYDMPYTMAGEILESYGFRLLRKMNNDYIYG